VVSTDERDESIIVYERRKLRKKQFDGLDEVWNCYVRCMYFSDVNVLPILAITQFIQQICLLSLSAHIFDLPIDDTKSYTPYPNHFYFQLIVPQYTSWVRAVGTNCKPSSQ
jgi:hypothetical protein